MGTVGQVEGLSGSWWQLVKIVLFGVVVAGLPTLLFLWVAVGFSPGTIIQPWSPFNNDVNTGIIVVLLLVVSFILFRSLIQKK